jgi:hypothetical protein
MAYVGFNDQEHEKNYKDLFEEDAVVEEEEGHKRKKVYHGKAGEWNDFSRPEGVASTGSESHVGEFSGSVSRSTQLEKAPLIPPRLITELPNLQYFMRISGGSVYQGRIPIIQG